MEPGVYNGIPAETYHAGPGINVSSLKELAKEGGPARVRYGARRETKALEFGRLIHTAVLEPDDLDNQYYPVNLGQLNAKTKAYQEAELQAAGREIVRRVEYDEALRIRDGVLHNPVARDMLAPGHVTEQSFYWIDEETGVLCRGRADGARADYQVLFDLKSTFDATFDGFGKSIDEYKYYWQDAWYQDGWSHAAGWTPQAFIFIAVEKERPYLTAAYEIEEEKRMTGRDEVRAQLHRYAHYEATDTWPGLPDELRLISGRRRMFT